MAGAWGQRHQRGMGQRPISEAQLSERNELRLRWQSGEYGNSPISRFALLQTEKKCPFRVDQNPYFRRFSTFTIGYLS